MVYTGNSRPKLVLLCLLSATQALRSGALNAASTDLDSAVEAANHFYAGAFFTFYDMWLSGNKTMSQSGESLKALRLEALLLSLHTMHSSALA